MINPWTCLCDCAVGYCRDDNNRCYLPCAESIDNTLFGGCTPGWDCPWFPDAMAGHCRSEMHPSQQFQIYRTSGKCCAAHFGGSSACAQKSEDSHPPFLWPVHFPGTPEYGQHLSPEEQGRGIGREIVWYPDLKNELNCIQGRDYEPWMSGKGFAEYYLFPDADDCCAYWFPYPDKVDCPYTGEVFTVEEDHATVYADPSPAQGYFYPVFSVSVVSCGFGQDYPSWMASGGFEKHYLFTKGKSCCEKFFSSSANCPFEDETTDPQSRYYWEKYQENVPNAVAHVIYNHIFYPDIDTNARTCVNGTDYPGWMASNKEFIRLYLYKNNPQGCCNYWFGEDTDGCVKSIIQSTYIDTNDAQAADVTTVDKTKMWYPILDEKKCKNDGSMPSWMLEERFKLYLLHSRQQCNDMFGFS